MKMSELEAHAQICVENNLPLVTLVGMPGFTSPELITTPPENIMEKMKYYKETYDEECNHLMVKGNSIIEVVHSEPELLVGQTILPHHSLLENHIRVEDSYTIDAREKRFIVEGQIDDVLKVLQFRQGDVLHD